MRRATFARVALVGAVVATLAAGCAAPPTEATSASGSGSGAIAQAAAGPGVAVAPTSGGVRVAIVGDSLTAGGGRLLSEGLTADTWMTYAQGDGVDYVGGYAKGGSTVQEQAAAVRPVADVDVLVLMSGTNDVRLGTSFAESASSYDAIVDTIRPEHVVVAAIPPYDRAPRAAARYEAQLERYVADKGWTFTDPWGFARAGDVFAAGTTVDGIHPTTAGYEAVGHALRDVVLDVAGSRVVAPQADSPADPADTPPGTTS
ncbi:MULTISPECIES: SGNH/GDSL hydrolase family protein [unclassified Frigoribacterium]|uniref:SGNH/GDSL hydrolase family protein n=1 Tax=unclassified Frigoribacterium TaxID=2627005 RepID=UPI000FBA4643|nr:MULTISPECIES: SGNH/GDSL hydrolase family protein [unclassified Frigoribacterium]ROS50177.1 lysophospholipase L1-like esterase [Frigoribacterium sp. PhB118]